jgi:hypothetical protein
MNISELELSFHKYTQNLGEWIPDGITPVSLPLLQRLNLLTATLANHSNPEELLTHYFHVVENKEKITLFNDQFVVWIIPEYIDHRAKTFVLIALQEEKDLRLEMALSAEGVYNSSKMVLRVIEKLLIEIQDTERELSSILNSQSD